MITKLAFRIALAAVAIHFSRAQAQGDLSLQFLSFPQQISPAPVELLIGEGRTMPIEIPGNEFSPVYKIKRPNSIVVGMTAKNEKGEPVFQILGKAPPLASSKQIILLLRKGETNSDGFMMLPIDGSLSEFPGGNYLFINVAKLSIGGKIGDKIFKLQPGEKELLKPAATHEGGGCQVTLTYQKDEEWKIFYDTRWSVNKRYRSLVFFYQDPESGSLGVAPILDIL
jgi:hypothetical protein